MNHLQIRGDLEVGRFEGPNHPRHPNALPTVAANVAPPAAASVSARITLFDELRQKQCRGAELDEQEAAINAEAHELAAQRERLVARRTELEQQAAADRFERMQAALAGTKLPKRSDAADNLEVIDAARAQVDVAEEAVARKRIHLSMARTNLQREEYEVRWRITLARYALIVKDLVPLAKELAELARVERRSFQWGQGLVINPNSGQDIAGIPLSLALEMAANLGEELTQ